MRLASLAPSNTEVLFALGAGDSVCAVTSYCDAPKGALAKPRLAGWSNLKAAEVLALQADRIFTSSICQASLVEDLKTAGAPLIHLDPRDLAGVAESFRVLGREAGLAGAGDKMAAKFQRRLGELGEHTPADGYWPRVFVEEWHQPPMAAGNWVPELVRLAGGTPFLMPPGALSREVSWEEVMEFDPEIVVFSLCGKGKDYDPAEWFKTEGWKTLSAAKANRVFTVDDSLFNRPGPRLLAGGVVLQALIGESFWGWPRLESPFVRRLGSS